MEQVRLHGPAGRSRKRCRYVVADKGYDSDVLRRYCDRHRIKPVIGNRKMHRTLRPGLPRGFDKPKYRQRHIIGSHFGWVKELQRICTRFDKLASSFRAMVCLACIDRCLRTWIHRSRVDREIALPGPPQIRACSIDAPGSSIISFAEGSKPLHNPSRWQWQQAK